jgi:hypothetical protein
MKRLTGLLIGLLFLIQSNIHGNGRSVLGSTWQPDGRSISLGGGRNAAEPDTGNGISLSYLIPYQLIDLSSRSLKTNLRTQWMELEGSWTQTGDAVFRENYLALGAARALSGSLTLGVKTGYYRYDLINGEMGSVLLSEIQCRYRPARKMEISAYLFNPTGASLKRFEERVPLQQTFHLGISYLAARDLEILTELEKIQPGICLWHLGLEYALGRSFFLRTGLSTPTLQPSWGIGGSIHRFRYALGGNLHPLLGLSSCFSLNYSW